MQEKQFASDLKWIASLLALGILAIIGAFALDWFGGAPGLGLGQMLLIGIGGLLIITAFLFRRLAKLPFFPPILRAVEFIGKILIHSYRVIALLLLAPIVIFLAMELGYRVLLPDASLFGRPDPNAALHQAYLARAQSPYFVDQDWSLSMWESTYQITVNSLVDRPYVGWDYSPYVSEYVNVDEDSRRVTPNSDCSVEGVYRVYMFGGSTTWGYGVPDFGTIPAYLQTVLDGAVEGPVCVVNYGEIAYNSTQEVIDLALQLRQGNIPDLVLFYDGINDTRSAFVSNEAGIPYDLSGVRQISNPVTNPIIDMMRRNFYLVNDLIAHQPAPVAPEIELAPDLDAQVVHTYVENTRLVESFAQTYGFQYAFFWQPVLITVDKARTEHEEAQFSTSTTDHAFYNSVYNLMHETAANPDDNLYDLSTVASWSEVPDGEMFIDSAHLLPIGNEIMARTIAAIVLPQIEADR